VSDPRTRIVEQGYDVIGETFDEVVTFLEPEPDGEATFQWVLARG